jgi:type VI secretion system protein ImpM
MASFGLYGKIPSEGDFVTRRLPWEFTAAWDDWLQQGMQASRAALGERWLEIYLSAPVWRFHAAPGVFGPQGWRGLFFASVDRVGRYFPLTLAVADGAAPSIDSISADAEAWLAAEDAALAALAPTLSVDALDRGVETLAVPAAPPVAASAAPQRLVLYLPASEEEPAIVHGFATLPPPACFAELLAPAAPPPPQGSLVDLL